MNGFPEFTPLCPASLSFPPTLTYFDQQDINKSKASRSLKSTHSFSPALLHNWTLFLLLCFHYENMPKIASWRKKYVEQKQVGLVEALNT